MTDTQYQIYVSYADADKDWVINLVNGLKVYLRRQLGELSDNFIWAKYMLHGNENRLTIPKQRLQQSKYLLTLLSPAYLNTVGNSEIDSFANADNILVVECDKIRRPEKLQSFSGYQFWHEDKTGNVIRRGDPKPTVDEKEYYRLLDQVARDIAAKDAVDENRTTDSSVRCNGINVFLARTFIYSKQRDNLRKSLKNQGIVVLPHKNYGASNYDLLLADLKQSKCFIQLFDNDDISQTQYDVARSHNIPALRWCEKVALNCMEPVGMKIDAFTLKVMGWIRQPSTANITTQSLISFNNNSSPQRGVKVFIGTPPENIQSVNDIIGRLPSDNDLEFFIYPKKSEEFLADEYLKKHLIDCDVGILIYYDDGYMEWARRYLQFVQQIQIQRKDAGKLDIPMFLISNIKIQKEKFKDVLTCLQKVEFLDCVDSITDSITQLIPQFREIVANTLSRGYL